jgi:excisionase family DNA binding protein
LEVGYQRATVANVAVVDAAGVLTLLEPSTMSGKRPFVGDGLLTVSEVADLMRVSNMTVYRLIKSGQLKALRVGKNYRIRESEVDRYLSDRSVWVEGGE